MNNSIINLLIALKNASLSRKEVISIDYNNLSKSLVKVLYREGFIQSFRVITDSKRVKTISVVLRYYFNKPILNNLRLFSKPSLLKYMKVSDICNISDRKFVCFFSTNKGLLTTLECKKNRVGGKLLFMC